MSPYNWSGSNASVFYVRNDGYLADGYVANGYGVRPVINLKADTQFNEGSNGTASLPYIVQ